MTIRKQDLESVRRLPLFAAMAQDSFGELLQAAYMQRFPAQVELIAEGEMADFLHVVVDGCVELYATQNGRQSTFDLVQPVRSFILAAVLKDAPYLMAARTVLASRLILIPAENVRAALMRDATVAAPMALELASSFRVMVRALRHQKLRTGNERLAHYLLQQNDSQGGTGRVRLAYEKRLLASWLGMSPENLSRAFASLQAHGVTVNGADVHIADSRALESLAVPAPAIDVEPE